MSISVIGRDWLDHTRQVIRVLGGQIDRWHGGIVMLGSESTESALIYELSRTLYPDRFICTGKGRSDFADLDVFGHWPNGCPSWDHVCRLDERWETDYPEGRLHSDGDHALRQFGLDLRSSRGSYFRIRAREHLRLLSGRWGIDSW